MSNKINIKDSNVEFFQIEKSDLLDDSFVSNVDEFTEYYHIQCLGDVREELVQAYVIKVDGVNMGYVTLSMAGIENDATEAIKAIEVNGEIPALLISHLAVHKNHQRCGVGRALLNFVINDLTPKLKSLAGCRYIMLNPRDDQGVRDFYTAHGFDYVRNFEGKSDAFLYDLKRMRK